MMMTDDDDDEFFLRTEQLKLKRVKSLTEEIGCHSPNIPLVCSAPIPTLSLNKSACFSWPGKVPSQHLSTDSCQSS